MHGRRNKVLMSLAAVVLVVSLAVLLKPLLVSSHAPKLSPVAAAHSAALTAGSSNPVVRQNSPHGMAVNGATNSTPNNTPDNQTPAPSAYTIYHPPPAVSRHIHGIVNRRFSYPVRFIMAMASAAGGQTIALATEGQGLVMFRPAAQNPHRWVMFHPNKNGTGFPAWNTYSVCFDSQGRLWVGTLRKGVVVGKLGRRDWRWRHYGEICRPATAIGRRD